MTKNMVTRLYRPPEIIYGQTQYGLEVDMWSLGCLFAEIIKGTPLFPGYPNIYINQIGSSDIDQLDKIFSILGSPTEENWSGCTQLPFFLEFKQQECKDFKTIISNITLTEENVLKKLLVLDPKKRITAEELLHDAFFQEAQQKKGYSSSYMQIIQDIYQEKIQKYAK